MPTIGGVFLAKGTTLYCEKLLDIEQFLQNQTLLRVSGWTLTDTSVEQTGENSCNHWSRFGKKLSNQINNNWSLGNSCGCRSVFSPFSSPALASIDENELRMANIRPCLEVTLGLATKGASHSVRTIQMNASTGRSL
ncbi:MAG: hypothetical protein GY761_10225 [Hyphomicrobiales bacterium]|nr:hypothetical protein [Hyphomicrobiales bacterium]